MPTNRKKLLTIQSSFKKDEKENKARERFYKYCENGLSANDEIFKSILDDNKIFLEFKNELLKKEKNILT